MTIHCSTNNLGPSFYHRCQFNIRQWYWGNNQITTFLNTKFKVKNLGDIHYFLALEILREKQGFIILKEFNFSGSAVSSSLDPYSKLGADDGPLYSDPTLYRYLVGKLNYLTNTRPDLSFVVFCLSQFMQRPCLSHFTAGLRVLRYLSADPSHGIFLSSYPSFDLVAFCDSD